MNIAIKIGKLHMPLFSGNGVGVGVGNGVGVGVAVGVGDTTFINVNMPVSPGSVKLTVSWLPDTSMLTFCIW